MGLPVSLNFGGDLLFSGKTETYKTSDSFLGVKKLWVSSEFIEQFKNG